MAVKENNDDNPKVADTEQSGQVKAGNGVLADTAGVQPGIKRIRVRTDETDRQEGQPVNDSSDAQHGGEPGGDGSQAASRSIDKKARKARLTAEAQEHLRGRQLKTPLTSADGNINFIDDPAAQNPAMESYNHGYDLGYADGYTQAEEDFDGAYRLHVEKSAGITAKQFNGWQILGIVAPALLIGVVMGVLL